MNLDDFLHINLHQIGTHTTKTIREERFEPDERKLMDQEER